MNTLLNNMYQPKNITATQPFNKGESFFLLGLLFLISLITLSFFIFKYGLTQASSATKSDDSQEYTVSELV
jgi:hypothetical protein